MTSKMYVIQNGSKSINRRNKITYIKGTYKLKNSSKVRDSLQFTEETIIGSLLFENLGRF